MPISRMEPAGPAGASMLAGRFRLEERLGEDASGEIHRAVAVDAGTAAIVHIVRPEGGSARRDRLLREIKRAAQVKHAGLAVVLEVGQTASGDIFVAVEQNEGERLSDRLRPDTPLDEREAADIAVRIARALAAAHDAGVVHRDLRPSVIVLAGSGEDLRVTVEGLATPRLGAVAADDPEAPYASPEQRCGDSVGRRADVYSIGAMLYAMLTGRAPPSPPPPVESALGDVIRRCLAEDPRERFLDTIALGAALRAATEPKSSAVASRPPVRASTPPAKPSTPALVSATATVAERHPPSSHRPTSQRPVATLEPSSARAPAAPPPRPLGRPLTARPRWEEALLDLRDGPLPRVALTVIVAFVIARILTSGLVPFVVAIASGVAAYATKYWRGSRGGDA